MMCDRYWSKVWKEGMKGGYGRKLCKEGICKESMEGGYGRWVWKDGRDEGIGRGYVRGM